MQITGWLVTFLAVLALTVGIAISRSELEPPTCVASMDMIIDGGSIYETPIDALRAELAQEPELRRFGIDPTFLERTSGLDQTVHVDAGDHRTNWFVYRDGQVVWQATVLEVGGRYGVESWDVCNTTE